MIFENLNFSLNSRTSFRTKNLEDLIKKHGGKIINNLTKSVIYIYI